MSTRSPISVVTVISLFTAVCFNTALDTAYAFGGPTGICMRQVGGTWISETCGGGVSSGSSISSIQQQLLESERKLNEVNNFLQTLEGQARWLFDSLPEDERRSISQALASIKRRLGIAWAESQQLRRRLEFMTGENDRLQQEVLQAGEQARQLLREIQHGQTSIAALQLELSAINQELPVARKGVEILEKIALKQSRALQRARDEYWKTVSLSLFDSPEQGLPRDYTDPVYPYAARTSRGTKTVDTRLRLDLSSEKVVAVPAVEAVVSGFATAEDLARQESDVPATDKVTLSRNIQQLSNTVRDNGRLNKRIGNLMIENDLAREQLRASLQALARQEAERTWVGDKFERLKGEVAWGAYHLDVYTSQARSLLAGTGVDFLLEQRWNAIKKLWKLSLRDEALSNSSAAQLKFSYDLINGDLSRLPAAVRDSVVTGEVYSELENIAETRGEAFYDDLLNLSRRPQPFQKWIEKILGQKEHPGMLHGAQP